MPCFKGLAVSIHTPDGPLPEYSIQKQTKFSRISSYIPVPPPKVRRDSTTNKPEQSTFAISITLLTPGLNIPYSQPKPTPEDPYPRPRTVGGLPNVTNVLNDSDRSGNIVMPYIPRTTSLNETIAAYIYFDGRAKEEVATLLRRGEETWVNSRWVGIPETEGGGLAEREFLFREVGLERWLNGLDLEGKDAAAKIERRRQKVEKKRRKKRINKDSDDEVEFPLWGGKDRFEKGVLRYGADERSPLEQVSDDDEMFLSDTDSDDDPVPEAAGQIKVALFRVIASGEIKRGEYSPQFDAHDDDDESPKNTENGTTTSGATAGEVSVDHTTSFAQPKTLDPKSISTQTVIGLDGPDKPFAVFTFLYRGEKQLQKMGILPSLKAQDKPAATTAKRRSVHTDFANLKPLKPGGALGFSKFRDSEDRRSLGDSKAKQDDSDMDSDDDDARNDKKCKQQVETVDADLEDALDHSLSLEDTIRQGELADGVKKIRLKRQHSVELDSGSPATRKSPASNTPTRGSTPPLATGSSLTPPNIFTGATSHDLKAPKLLEDSLIGSPLKKQRASLPGLDDESVRQRLGLGLGASIGGNGSGVDVMGRIDREMVVAKPNEHEEEL